MNEGGLGVTMLLHKGEGGENKKVGARRTKERLSSARLFKDLKTSERKTELCRAVNIIISTLFTKKRVI